ncbi:MAG: hypothetical protein ACTSRG_10025 [Candidatus Helarchaeota archaeon]
MECSFFILRDGFGGTRCKGTDKYPSSTYLSHFKIHDQYLKTC